MPTSRVVLYARVSSKDQEKEGFSIPAQLRLLHDYAASKGFVIAHEFTDVETAKASGRTNFGRLLAYLQKHPGACRRAFSVSDGEPVSTPALLEELSKAACRRLWLFPLPMPVLRGVARCGDAIEHLTGVSVGWDSYSVERLCGSLVANCSDIHDRTGWIPPYSTSRGLQITVSSL